MSTQVARPAQLDNERDRPACTSVRIPLSTFDVFRDVLARVARATKIEPLSAVQVHLPHAWIRETLQANRRHLSHIDDARPGRDRDRHPRQCYRRATTRRRAKSSSSRDTGHSGSDRRRPRARGARHFVGRCVEDACQKRRPHGSFAAGSRERSRPRTFEHSRATESDCTAPRDRECGAQLAFARQSRDHGGRSQRCTPALSSRANPSEFDVDSTQCKASRAGIAALLSTQRAPPQNECRTALK